MIGRRRFDVEDVEPRSGDAPGFQRGDQAASSTIGPREV